MSNITHWFMAVFAALIAGLAAVCAALGVFARGSGALVTVTSPRGVTYDMATTGVYAYNANAVVAEGVGWDVFTLVVVVPATLLTAYFVGRGSVRAQLIAIGLFGYYLYQYLEYAVTWAFGPLFPLFIATFGLSVIGVMWFSMSVGREGITRRFEAAFPRRAFVGLNVAMAALLVAMWSGRIATGLGGDLAGAGLFSETTLTVQALDLGLTVPIALMLAVLVWRRDLVGYAGAAAYSVTSMAMAAALDAMLISSGIVTGEMPWPPIVIFGLFFIGFAWTSVRIYADIRLEQTPRPTARDAGGTRTTWLSQSTDA